MADRDQIERLLNLVVDPIWYRARHRDVAVSGADPLRHFIESGLQERRDPNRWFDCAWYTRQYADVAASGVHPLLHYMTLGSRQNRDPHPRFDAGWYVAEHPDAAGNPMLFHLRVGARRGWLTEKPVAIEEYLPSTKPPLSTPNSAAVDIVIPVYRDLALTQRCLDSVLADNDRPKGRIIVIDDRSPEPKLTAWLAKIAKTGAIDLVRNKTNLGFVASANLGMKQSAPHDVVLLNSDTEVPSGWLRRLKAQAYVGTKVASVSPLSNHATICSYLGYEGAPIPPGMTLTSIDTACRTVNAGRFVSTPTTVGFCMYLRRDALNDVGVFDEQTFGKGYGEENDFCLRAIARGWTHHIACDTFVAHASGTSFGDETDARVTGAFAKLTERYPDYPSMVARHVQDAANEPFRFAVTMELFRASGLPTILTISHDQEGGVRKHVHDLIQQDAGQVNYLVLEPASRGLSLSVPALSGHPKLVLAAERWRDVAAVARSAGVTRVHIHHLMGLDLDTQALIHDLGVPFDITVHDYFAICPQVTFLPWADAAYCEEPGPAGCDACIANRPSHGATDILSWRLRWSWQFTQAARVLAPSQDTLNRLNRFDLGEHANLMPHETAPSGPWPVHKAPKPGKKLRVAILGTLASHKGAHVAASVAMAADPGALEIVLLGHTEAGFPAAAQNRMTVHGAYQEGELPALLTKYRPHVVWFPAAWPETYSFTLSAAIGSGLPIVATDIGAFPERLAGRPMTWIVPPSMDPGTWLAVFESVRTAIRTGKAADGTSRALPPAPIKPRHRPLASGRTKVLVIAETFDDGTFTPCAYIRLLRPLGHPAIGAGLIVISADAAAATRYSADIVVTQRHAVPTVAAAEALAAHTRQMGATLIYDLDDDLLTVPGDHPEREDLRPKAAVVERMIRLADIVQTSTAPLSARIARLARRTRVLENALDERIWVGPSRPEKDAPVGIIGVLLMGTATHDADLALILPALTAVQAQFGDRVRFDMIGFAAEDGLPAWLNRIGPPHQAARSYPGFVNWVTGAGPWPAGPWDIGLAPLADTAFNGVKSAIKTLDYAALGLAVLASDVPAYRGSLADGPGGRLVANTDTAWYNALSRLIRDDPFRRGLAAGARRWLHTNATLAANAPAWASAWSDPPGPRRRNRA